MVNSALISSTTSLATHRVVTTWTWYVVRASGIVSVGLLLLLIFSGIGMVTGLTYKLFEPTKAWIIHRALALSLCAGVILHISFILLDHFVPFSLVQVLIPFTSQFQLVHIFGVSLGSLYIALGIISFYLLLIIVLSSLYWIDTKKSLWKLLHYLSYVMVIFIFIHALFLGTDFATGIVRKIWWAFGVLILLGMVSRLRRSGTMKETNSEKNTTINRH